MAEPDRPGLVPLLASNSPSWSRAVATAVNWLLARRMPFEPLASAPPSPVEGQAYYDTTLHVARMFDGTAWQDLW